MAGIHVLSDILKVGNNNEKVSTLKGKNAADSSENVVAVFSALLSDCMNPNANSKGQNSEVGQDSEETLNTGDSVQSDQNPNGLGNTLGYGNFAFQFLTQPMVQSDFPAGKEANSGNGVSQGIEVLSTTDSSLNNVQVVPAGNNPGTTELDKYRQVIADLLSVLSGEVKDTSPKEDPLRLETTGTKDLSQDMAKILQGWVTVTDNDAKNGQSASGQAALTNSLAAKVPEFLEALSGESTTSSAKVNQLSSDRGTKEIQSLIDVLSARSGEGNSTLNAKVATLLASLYPIASKGAKNINPPHEVNGKIQAEGDIVDPTAKVPSETFVKQSKGMGNDLDITAQITKNPAFLTTVKQKSNAVNLQEKSAASSEPSGVKDVQNQNSNTGIGAASNILAANVADGKTVAIPVWEQIASVFREQVTNRHQKLKELDIQLHPAELGKIQIAMRWENGQVHLQVQASESATGQLIQNQLSDLRQTLTSQGVNCGMLQMGQGGDRQHNPRGNEPQKMLNQNTQPNEEENLIPDASPLSLGRDGPNGINRINVTA